MAKAIWISNGVGINAGWTEQIAVSYNGTDWTPLYKNELSVHPIATASAQTNPPKVLGNETLENTIALKDIAGNTVLRFNCADVQNQAAWNPRTAAALRTAVSDIAVWISL